jgi:hypothetical protein
MREHSSCRIFLLTIVALTPAVPAWTQSALQTNEWARGTTLAGFVGVAADSSRTGPMFGGSVGWELTPRLAIEGSGLWVDHVGEANSFAGALKVQAALLGPHKAVPFVQAGIGLYRASLDRTQGEIPAFYRRRMEPDDAGHGVVRTFTDPALVFGGGANVFLSRSIAIRPDVEAMVVLDDSRAHVVTAVRVNLVFHFEDHPVTPARARR